jgi:hypothetical protein
VAEYRLYRPTWPTQQGITSPQRRELRAARRRLSGGLQEPGPTVLVNRNPSPVPRVSLTDANVPPSDDATYRTDGGDGGTLGGIRQRRVVLGGKRPRVSLASLRAADQTLPGEFDSGSSVPYWGAGVASGSSNTLPKDSAVRSDSESSEAIPTAFAGAGGFLLFAVIGWFLWSIYKNAKG